MQIPVLIEPLAGNGYRAQGVGPWTEAGEGATPDDALERVRQSLQRRLQAGAQIVCLDVPACGHPWQPFAGMFQETDPLIQKWLKIMRSGRDSEAAE